jgi:excisionase family DNA binding protein
MDELMTITEAARILKLSTFTVRRYIKVGKLPAAKVGGQWRIRKNDLIDFVAGDK